MASSNINPRTYIYTTDTIPNTGQTTYTFTATESLICDILIVAGDRQHQQQYQYQHRY